MGGLFEGHRLAAKKVYVLVVVQGNRKTVITFKKKVIPNLMYKKRTERI